MVRLPYAMQDALSLLVMGPRTVGRGVGSVSPSTAKRLLERKYVTERPPLGAGIGAPGARVLEVTEEGRQAYESALARSHTERNG